MENSNKVLLLKNACIEKLTPLVEKWDKEYSNLEPIYIAKKLQNDGKDMYAISNKMNDSYRKKCDCKILQKIISNLHWEPVTKQLAMHLNPYGIFYDRKTVYFEKRFFDLLIDTQAQVLFIEIFNAYAQKNYENEAFLTLCHIGLVDFPPKYAISTRGQIVKRAIEKGCAIPILFVRSQKTKKYVSKMLMEENNMEAKDIPYCFTQKSYGWGYPVFKLEEV